MRESSAEVASSSTSTGGFFSSIRAIATRCFSPPESFRPRSPTGVSQPAGSEAMNAESCAAPAAASISASGAPGLP